MTERAMVGENEKDDTVRKEEEGGGEDKNG